MTNIKTNKYPNLKIPTVSLISMITKSASYEKIEQEIAKYTDKKARKEFVSAPDKGWAFPPLGALFNITNEYTSDEKIKLMELFIANGADVNQKYNSQVLCYALDMAILHSEDISVIKTFMKHKAIISDEIFYMTLNLSNVSLDVFKLLIDNGLNVNNLKMRNEKTLLSNIIQSNIWNNKDKIAMLKIALDAGADINEDVDRDPEKRNHMLALLKSRNMFFCDNRYSAERWADKRDYHQEECDKINKKLSQPEYRHNLLFQIIESVENVYYPHNIEIIKFLLDNGLSKDRLNEKHPETGHGLLYSELSKWGSNDKCFKELLDLGIEIKTEKEREVLLHSICAVRSEKVLSLENLKILLNYKIDGQEPQLSVQKLLEEAYFIILNNNSKTSTAKAKECLKIVLDKAEEIGYDQKDVEAQLFVLLDKATCHENEHKAYAFTKMLLEDYKISPNIQKKSCDIVFPVSHRTKILNLLLKNGLDVTATGIHGLPMIMEYCYYNGNPEMQDADCYEMDNPCIRKTDMPFVHTLLKHGADINTKGLNNETIIMYFMQTTNIQDIKKIFEENPSVDLTIRDKLGNTWEDYAKDNDNENKDKPSFIKQVKELVKEFKVNQAVVMSMDNEQGFSY